MTRFPMKTARRIASRISVATLALLAFLPGLCPAQEATARIIGTISDSSGAVIPECRSPSPTLPPKSAAKPPLTMTATFRFWPCRSGTTKSRRARDGFRTVISAEHKLLINQALRIDLTMQVGTTSQTVEVGAEAAPVETVNATLGQSVTGRALTNMPLNGRDMLDLALLQPGVTESNDDNGGAGNYSIAGGRTDSVTFLLDGGLNNDLLDNSNLLDPNPDAIAEFRLLTSNYTAEYGRNGGGIISVVTKSGTNQIHGSAFEFFRNRVLDANDFFNIPAWAFRGSTSNAISTGHSRRTHRQGQDFLLPRYQGTETDSGCARRRDPGFHARRSYREISRNRYR